MSISSQSRYVQGKLTRIPNSSGVYNLSVIRTVPNNTSGFSLYVWKSLDRPDLVAHTLLGNSNLWWAIFDINPELINPLNVPAGTVVRIPINPVMGQGTLAQ